MGCCFEPPTDYLHKGSLTYPLSLLVELEQIRGLETGRKHFRPNTVTTDLNVELRFRNLPNRESVEPLTLKPNRKRDALGSTLGSPIHGTETLQGSNLRGRSQHSQSPSHRFHTRLLRQPHYLNRTHKSRRIRGKTRANSTRASHVSKTHPARVSGSTSDLRNSIFAPQMK